MANSPSSTPALPGLLTSDEAADRLAVSKRTLWSLTKEGRVRCVRIGRSVRYDPRDLEAFIAAAKKGGGV